jgi:hypothetical protein
VCLCKKDVSKVEPKEWLEVPAETDWVEIPADGRAEGRGMGDLDMARAMRSGGKPRSAADLAIHVLDIMESSAASAASGDTTPRVDHLHVVRPPARGLEPTSEIDLSISWETPSVLEVQQKGRSW